MSSNGELLRMTFEQLQGIHRQLVVGATLPKDRDVSYCRALVESVYDCIPWMKEQKAGEYFPFDHVVNDIDNVTIALIAYRDAKDMSHWEMRRNAIDHNKQMVQTLHAKKLWRGALRKLLSGIERFVPEEEPELVAAASYEPWVPPQ